MTAGRLLRGLGSFAVQLAKDTGAQVTAVASTEGQAVLARLAPDHALDLWITLWIRCAGRTCSVRSRIIPFDWRDFGRRIFLPKSESYGISAIGEDSRPLA